METHTSSDDRLSGADGELAELLAELASRLQTGEQVNLEDYIQSHKEYAQQLEQMLPAMLTLAEMGLDESSVFSSSTLTRDVSSNVSGNVGDYKLTRELGRGGMGVVYEAEQQSLGRGVALKILPFAALLNETQLERFATEATAAARLQHDNIVTVYSVGCERGIHFIAMQLIDGPSLAEVIAEIRHERQPDEKQQESADTVVARKADVLTRDEDGGHYRAVARIGHEAAEALHYAHENGVLHRDIKPSNLLLDNSGHVWIADFGLARVEDESQLTRTGDILGTIHYMSPEQATGQRDQIDARADVYGLGATLYELATLRPVFDNEDRGEVIKQVVAGNPVAPHKIAPSVPRPLSLVISKAMARSLDERYQSAQELADDLQRFLDGEPVRARPSSPLRRVKTTLFRHPIITLSSTALLIAACLYIPNVLHRLGTNEPDNSSVTSSTDTGDPNMFRSAPKKRMARKNERIRQLRHEQLEDRRLLAGVEISIDDVTAIEGDDTSEFVDQFLPAPGLTGEMEGIPGLAIGPDGYLYVTSASTNEILRYNQTTGELIDVFVPSGSGGLDNPRGLTFGPDGTELYVTGQTNGEVLRYDGTTGAYIDTPIGSGRLGGPTDLDFADDGTLYVASWGTDEVLRYNVPTGETGELLNVVMSANDGLDGPTRMSVHDGQLFVSSSQNDQVLRYDGQTTTVFVSPQSGGLGTPMGLAHGPDGYLYVSGISSATIHRYDGTDGSYQGDFIQLWTAWWPGDLLITSGEMYSAGVGPNAIGRFDAATGDPIGEPILGTRPRAPSGIEFGTDGNLYISNWQGGSVVRYGSQSGNFLDYFVNPNSDDMTGARKCHFGPNGYLYVANHEYNELYRFNATTGAFVDIPISFADYGLTTPAEFIFHTDGLLYVSGERTDNVLRFDPAAEFAFFDEFVSPGVGGLDGADGMVFGPDGNLYVVSWHTGEILQYNNEDGTFMGVFADLGAAEGGTLVVGPDDHFYVSRKESDSVQRYDAHTGAYIDDFVPSGLGGVWQPWAMTFDDNGALLVANQGPTNSGYVMRYATASHAVFTVSLSHPSDVPVTVEYFTSAGTADSGIDFKPISGTLTFDPGVTTRSIVVPTIDDLDSEDDETFAVTLSNPIGGATIPTGQETGTATILDNDTYTTIENNNSLPLKDAKNAARPGVTTSTIDVGGLSSILDLNVTLDISHSYVGQLTATLIAPDDSRVELFSNVGGDSDLGFAVTTFDDDAAASITTGAPPFAGTFQPEGSLAVLDGIIASGTWRLEISDNAKGVTGTLNSWALEIAALPGQNTPPVAADDSASTDKDTGVTVQVLDNDTDADNDDLTVDAVGVVTPAQHGTVVNNGDSVTYIPDGVNTGTYTFEYTVSDGKGGTDTGEVSITVSEASTETVIYVYDIRFESKANKGKDWRAVFEIRTDSDGAADEFDSVAPGAQIEVTFAGNTYSGTTDSNGVFATGWIRNLRGTHVAEVQALALLSYFWDLDLGYGEETDDDDLLPDRIFNR